MAKRQAPTTDAKPLPRNSSLPAHLLEKYKNFAGIKAIERRVLTGELPGSVDLRLKEDPAFHSDPLGKKRYWYLRWINTKIPGRFSNITTGMGYVPVRLSELQEGQAEAIGDLHRDATEDKDPVVRRGDKGELVLVKMPAELYTAAKAAQKNARDRRSKNARLVKEDMASRAASAFGREGSEAADTIHDEFDLTLRRRRTTLGDEAQPLSDAERDEILDRA